MMRMMMATAALLALATAAAAQEAEPTSPAAPIVTHAPAAASPVAPTLSASTSPEASVSTARQISAWIGEDGDAKNSSVLGVVSAMPARRDHAIHGEVGASIGSGGYRSAYGVVNMPIGEHSDVTVAIADQHLGGGNRGRRYGYRGGDRQSLGIALNLNGVGHGAPVIDCEAAPKWSLGLPDDAALSNRCRRLQQANDISAAR